MALRFIESFETYGAVNTEVDDLIPRMSGKWDEIKYYNAFSDMKLVEGVNGGIGLRMTSGLNSLAKYFDNQETWIVGFWLKVDSWYPGSGRDILRILDDTDIQVAISLDGPNQKLLVEANGVNMGASSAIDTSTWYFIELETTIDSTASGTYDLRIDEVSEVNGTAVTSKSGNDYAQSIMFYNDQTTAVIDDIYIADGTNGVNSPLGRCVVSVHYPTDDAATSDWSPSTGSDHFAVVNDTVRDATTYVSTDTNTDEDMYKFTPEESQRMYGIQLSLEGASNGSEVKGLRGIVRFDGNDSTVDEVILAGANTPTSLVLISEYQVNTSNRWTLPSVNSSEFGCEKLS